MNTNISGVPGTIEKLLYASERPKPEVFRGVQVLQPSKAKRFFFLGHPVVENITISRYWIWNEFEDFDLVSAKSSHNWQFSFKKIFVESTYKLLPDDDILLMLYYIFYLFLLSIEGYPRTPDSSEGLIPRAIICYMGIDPFVLFF